ncbi:hypothetical protein FJ366_02545 [Candidatus Dependentiae bacterium]|nr:hypothetical protein [Candidatus Dependentiae bacterium]
MIESFKTLDLIDECIITIIPTNINEGISLPSTVFDGMQKISSFTYPSKIQQDRYTRKQTI